MLSITEQFLTKNNYYVMRYYSAIAMLCTEVGSDENPVINKGSNQQVDNQ